MSSLAEPIRDDAPPESRMQPFRGSHAKKNLAMGGFIGQDEARISNSNYVV